MTTEGIFNAVIDGDQAQTVELVQNALDDNIAADEILKKGLIAAMGEVGRRFEEGEFFVPEMLIAARAMSGALELLKPHLVDQGIEPLGKVVIGTVKGDLHDIGKNLVAMMMEGAGFEIIDLGVDVSPDQFVEAVKTNDAQIVAMSALLTTTMPSMEATIQAINQADLPSKPIMMVGGAPVTEAYANSIGAKGYAPDASAATRIAKNLLDIS